MLRRDMGASPGIVERAACALHANGEETHGTVLAAERLAQSLGDAVVIAPHWGGLLFADASSGATECVMVREAVPSNVGMNRVSAVIAVIDEIEAGRLEADKAEERLKFAARLPASNFGLFVLACGAGGVALSLIFGAHKWQAVMLVAGSGAAGGALRRLLGRWGVSGVAQAFAAALLAGLIGAWAVKLKISSELRLVAVCPGMILVPGPHLLNGALDLAALRLPLGASRLLFAGLVLTAISAGLVVGLGLGGTDLPASAAGRDVPIWLDTLAAGVAAACYSIYFSMPLSMLVWPVLVGMLAHAMRWAAMYGLGFGPAEGAGVACLVVGAVLIPVAERLRLPFAGIGFASVVSLMPGVFIFRMASGLVQILRASAQASPELLASVTSDGMTAALIVLFMTIGIVVPKSIYNGVAGAGARPQAHLP